MPPAEIVELVGDLVEARMVNDREQLVMMIDHLLKGPVVDTLNVSLVLAGLMAEGAPKPPPGEAAISVVRVDTDGTETPGTPRDLPPYVAIFVQMIAAVVAEDREMARDLFIGYVGSNGERALKLLTYALTEVAHSSLDCTCGPNTIEEEAS
jgi:hypothetical protein